MQTLHARNPLSIASCGLEKNTLFSGFVRLPGGQLGLQNILVVVHPF